MFVSAPCILLSVRRLRVLAGVLAAIAMAGIACESALGITRDELKDILKSEMDSVGGHSGAYVLDLDESQNRVLYRESDRTGRSLASNTKLFTTAAYLEGFGGDSLLFTRLFADGELTGAADSTLDGSLVLVGGGDPALATRSFAKRKKLPLTSLKPLAKAVENAGIETVSGNLVADPTIFDEKGSVPVPGVNPDLGDLPTLSGLSFNRGTEDGNYAKNPPKNAGKELISELKKRGVRVQGKVKVEGAAPGVLSSDPLGLVESPSAKALVRQTNTPSDNFYAEMLMKLIGTSPGKEGTTKRGAKRTEEFAEAIGSRVKLVNGSGLARTNEASPRQVGRLLEYMRTDEAEKGIFLDSLAVAGKSGTLSDRMEGTAAEGKCHAKTGTISEVSALSGYCRTDEGFVAFSILMNGVSIDAARRAQDNMAAAIARYG
jgi:serine-type D-Ala-D-Ala carboxypeptidase/endopeptidase (penicillin-binding protein 4)